VLTGANINTKQAASDIVGQAGRAILDALVAGETDPSALAALGDGRLRTPPAERRAALTGTLGAHQREVLRLQLTHIDFLDAQIQTLTETISARLAPHSDALARLDTIPGVGLRTAEVLVTELGTDMSRFPSAGHATAWAGLSPGQHESGGTRHHAPTRRATLPAGGTGRGARAAAKSRTTIRAAPQRRVPRPGKGGGRDRPQDPEDRSACSAMEDHQSPPLPNSPPVSATAGGVPSTAAFGYAVTLTPSPPRLKGFRGARASCPHGVGRDKPAGRMPSSRRKPDTMRVLRASPGDNVEASVAGLDWPIAPGIVQVPVFGSSVSCCWTGASPHRRGRAGSAMGASALSARAAPTRSSRS
jgi:hypothetical protein